MKFLEYRHTCSAMTRAKYCALPSAPGRPSLLIKREKKMNVSVHIVVFSDALRKNNEVISL